MLLNVQIIILTLDFIVVHSSNVCPLWHLVLTEYFKRTLPIATFVPLMFFFIFPISFSATKYVKLTQNGITGIKRHAATTACSVFVRVPNTFMVAKWHTSFGVQIPFDHVYSHSYTPPWLCGKGTTYRNNYKVRILGERRKEDLDPYRYSWDIDIPFFWNCLILAVFLALCTWCELDLRVILLIKEEVLCLHWSLILAEGSSLSWVRY